MDRKHFSMPPRRLHMSNIGPAASEKLFEIHNIFAIQM